MKKATITNQCKITCTLNKTCKHPFMKMSGDLSSEILLIGEGPGSEEDEMGLQFIGDSGKLLRHALALANITKFALTNAVRCRPPGNRDPKTIELKTCRSFLLDDIAQMPNLKLLVLFGNWAMLSVLGYKGILEFTGTLQSVVIPEVTGKPYFAMPIMHPSYVLQHQSSLNRFINHVGRIPNASSGALVDPKDEGTYYVVDNIKLFDQLITNVKKKGLMIYDLETTALDPWAVGAKIKCLGISYNPREGYTIPFQDWTVPEWQHITSTLREIFEDPTIPKIGANIKFDNLWMKKILGIDVKGTFWDVGISQFLLDENESTGVKQMTWKYTKLGGYEKLVSGEPHLAEGPNLYKYNGMDVDIEHRIFDIHYPEITKDAGLWKLTKNLLIPASDVLMRMQYRGIGISPDRLNECEKATDIMLESLKDKIYQLDSVKQFEKDSGLGFNPNSHTQMRDILFKYEGLTPIKKTAKSKAYSTDRSVLDYYKDDSKICEYLIDHSLYSNMKNKMINGLRKYNRDNRIHTTFWLTNTVTGRTASDDPPMQNVTKGEKDVVGIRKVFIADPGYYLVEADYNQHELRCMAELAEDDALYKAILTGDLHTETAAFILKKDPYKITPDERRNVGKTFNFGISYGLTIHGIVKRLKCTPKQAEEYLNRFFKAYAKTKLYMDATELFVKENGYVKSRTGRYRRFPIWGNLDDESVRQAINAPVQALAGDIMLFSMIALEKFLESYRSYMCLEVHDSILFNIHKSELSLIPRINEIMSTSFKQYIEFAKEVAIDFKIGENWGDMEKYKV